MARPYNPECEAEREACNVDNAWHPRGDRHLEALPACLSTHFVQGDRTYECTRNRGHTGVHVEGSARGRVTARWTDKKVAVVC